MNEEQFLDSLIGLNVNDATNIAQNNGYYVRITSRDGRDYMITCDFQCNRINFKTDNGFITEATTG